MTECRQQYHMHCTLLSSIYQSITIMDRKMLAAIVAATLLPLFVNAREGPECPADPYVSDFRNRYKQQLTFRHLLKPIGELL